jgi:O-antigen/teichoic acid export membrane protein
VSELQTERPAPAEELPPPRRVDPSAWVRERLREPYVQLLASQLFTAAIAMVANVLMARALTPQGRGEVALMLQIVYLATQVLLLGTERSFTAVFHRAAPAAAVRAYARLLLVPCALGLLAAVVFAVAAPRGFNPGPRIVALVACYAIVDAAILGTRAIAVAVGRMADFVRYRFVDSLCVLVTMTVLYREDVRQPVAWVLAYLLAGALSTVAYVVFWLRLPAPATAPATGQGRLVRREGLTLFPAALANMAMLRVDRLALPALASTTALGLYTSVATMTELLAWPLRAFADSRLGKWRAAHREGELRARPLVLAAAVYALVVAPVLAGGLYLLIVPVFGERYAAAKVVVLPLVAAAGLYAVSRVSLGLLIAKGHGTLVSVAEICGFLVSLVAYLLLIPGYGILGAAYGSLLGYGACLIFAIAASWQVGDRIPRDELGGDPLAGDLATPTEVG